jgi:hypothetical protein
MTTSDLERRLTGLLQARAEEAMERTNTQEELSSLLASRRRNAWKRGRSWTAGGLVVATATAAVAVWMTRGDGDRAEPVPAGVDTVQLASKFLEAVYSHDADRTAPFLSPDVQISHPGALGTVPVSEWHDELAWQQAIGASLVDHVCRVGETSSSTSEAICTYSLHGLGSDQLRRGPYAGNTLDMTIRDGLIVAFEDEWDYMDNGFSAEMWEPFAAWVAREHPSDLRVMYTDADQNLPRLGPRSSRRWERRVSEWVVTQR